MKLCSISMKKFPNSSDDEISEHEIDFSEVISLREQLNEKEAMIQK